MCQDLKDCRFGDMQVCRMCGTDHTEAYKKKLQRLREEEQASVKHHARMRTIVRVSKTGWTGSRGFLGIQWPQFQWLGERDDKYAPKLVGEGRIHLAEGVERCRLLDEVVLKGIPDDITEVQLTINAFGDTYYTVKRTDGQFVLPKGFDLGKALGI